MSLESTINNKRIAKNTIFLFFRMFLLMGIGLYTSRIVLKVLGVSDYGIFNVMGGIIGMLAYANTLLAGGISRFLTIGLGEGDELNLKKLFGTSLAITMISALVVFILGETIGLWFVNAKLNIDSTRMVAANWVYQCALVSSCLTIVQSPFTASVISHERMNIYAYMSLLDAALKLGIVYILIIGEFDKLILYSVLLFCTNLIDIIIYRYYCLRSFNECHSKPVMDIGVFKNMLSYNSWNMVGGLAGTLANHGVNIIINIFFGTAVNAARGVATQVSSIVTQFYSNFQTAATPQIMKYYSKNNMEELYKLAINTSKYCAYLLMCVIIPILYNIEGLLRIWLVEVPEYASYFAQCAMIYTLICAINAPNGQIIHAVGKMKLPNLSTAMINMCVFPITYLIFYFGGNPIWGSITQIISVGLCMCVDLLMVRYFVAFPVKKFVVNSIIPVLEIFVLCSVVAFFMCRYIGNNSTVETLISSSVSTLSTMFFVIALGLPKAKRETLLLKFRSLIKL